MNVTLTSWNEEAPRDPFHPIPETRKERELASGLPLVTCWFTAYPGRRYRLGVELAGLEVAHFWELEALDAVEAENRRDDGDDGPTGPGWFLFVPGNDLSPHAFTPDNLPASPLLSLLVEEYATQLERLAAEPLPEWPGRRPRRQRIFPTDRDTCDGHPRFIVAADCVEGVAVDPELPEGVEGGPQAMAPEELDLWEGRPYIVTLTLAEAMEPFESYFRHKLAARPPEHFKDMREDWARQVEEMRRDWTIYLETTRKEYRDYYPEGVRYRVECLDWGVVDRPQDWGTFATLEDAVACACTGPTWRRPFHLHKEGCEQ